MRKKIVLWMLIAMEVSPYHGPRRRAREEASDVIFIFAHADRQWKPAT